MMSRLRILFFALLPLAGIGQGNIIPTMDTMIYYNQNQENYYFYLEGKNQKLFFDTSIYDNSRPITLFIKNNTPNKINIYPKYHANTYCKFDPNRYIESNGYLKVQLHINSKFKFMNPFTGYIKIEYWDSLHTERKEFQLVFKGMVSLGSLSPFTQDSLNKVNTSNSSDLTNQSASVTKQKNSIKTDTVVTIIVDNRRTYSDTLPFPIPSKYDSIPFQEDKISEYRDVRIGIVNRKIFVDGTVLEYYKDGKLYSKRSKVDGNHLNPFFISYYMDGKLWSEEFIDQTIEYGENGRIKSITKDNVKTTYFYTGNGKPASIEYFGSKRKMPSPYLTKFNYRTGCKTQEVYTGYNEGRIIINYSEDTCDCPKSKITDESEVYYKNCDFTVDKIITLNFPSIKTGEFDSHFNLVAGKEEIGQYMGKNRTYSFHKLNNQYLTEFAFRRFAETNNQKFYDSIFVIEFNRIQNEKRHGTWLDCDLSIEKITNKFYVWKPEFSKIYEFVYQYPWNIYEKGQLIETQYYSKEGDMINRIKYNGTDTIVTHYEYKLLLLDSNIVNIDTMCGITGRDTITYHYLKNYNTVLIYENQELKQKTSPIVKIESYSSGPPVHSSGLEHILIPFTIEKGEFRELKLYNGTIEYYDKNAKLIKIDTVIIGK